ncbi:hypothetical protein [Phyllobacterium sp. K27]
MAAIVVGWLFRLRTHENEQTGFDGQPSQRFDASDASPGNTNRHYPTS